MNQMTHLLKGTLGLGRTFYANQFVLLAAGDMKKNGDANFTTEESIGVALWMGMFREKANHLLGSCC